MSHVYDDTFFDYIDSGARASARALIAHLQPLIMAQSVVDFGSGRGVWLAEWKAAGVDYIFGLDGDYVNRDQLAIPDEAFRAVDLTQAQNLERRFDLAQSLEVGEHLPECAAKTLVASMVASSDRVLFSAAVKGQGGEFHINEQPLSYWQNLFEAHGYYAYDCIRPGLAGNTSVEPWYRYNSVFYANDAGAQELSESVLATRVVDKLKDAGNLRWRARKAAVSLLPRSVVTMIAKRRAALLAARAANAG